jgi:PadR family transcriptional regulator, regulatory protein PadR
MEHLGELEELALLVSAALYEAAYAVSVHQELVSRHGRSISLPAVHTVLHRLQEKGFLTSEMGGGSEERGGRRKRLFKVTQAGYIVLREQKSIRESLYERIPGLSYGIS